MKKLLIASIDVLPQLGGISIATHHLANAFVDLGVTVTILGPAGAAVPADWTARYSLVVDEASNPQLREGREWLDRQAPRLDALITGLWEEHNFDHALATHPFYFGLPMVAAAQAAGKSASVMFHGYELRSQLLLKERFRSWRMRRNGYAPSLSDETHRLAQTADEVLVNSAYTAGLVKQTGTKAPVHITGCGLDLSEAQEQIERTRSNQEGSGPALRQSLGLEPEDFVIGTLGRLVESKNVGAVIEATARIPHAKALIIGDGPQRNALQALARQKGVAKKVTFLGSLTESEKWAALRALNAFCLVSKPGRQGQVEGFGLVLLEASAAGVPVIAARSGGMMDVVEHERTGLSVANNNLTALVGAIQNIADHPKRAKERMQAMQMDILDRFNWCSIASTLKDRWAKGNGLA